MNKASTQEEFKLRLAKIRKVLRARYGVGNVRMRTYRVAPTDVRVEVRELYGHWEWAWLGDVAMQYVSDLERDLGLVESVEDI